MAVPYAFEAKHADRGCFFRNVRYDKINIVETRIILMIRCLRSRIWVGQTIFAVYDGGSVYVSNSGEKGIKEDSQNGFGNIKGKNPIF